MSREIWMREGCDHASALLVQTLSDQAMAASASSSSAADGPVADLPQPQTVTSLCSVLIRKAARSEATKHAVIAQLNDTNEHVVVEEVNKYIDGLLVAKGLQGIITISPQLTSVDSLLRLAYFLDKSGDWTGWEPLVRVAVHQGRGEGRLPIELGSADVEAVGSRAVFDGRCEALRQLSLIARHLDMTLERVSNSGERLGGNRLTIRTRHTLPRGSLFSLFRNRFDLNNPACEYAEDRLKGYPLMTIRPPETLPANHPFRNGYDEANPVCEYHGAHFLSVRDAVLCRMGFGGSKVVDQCVTLYNDTARYNRLRQLARQPPPIWGCHTISTSHWAGEAVFRRMMVLQGDQPSHTFEAHLYIYSTPGFADAYLWTTERRVAGKEGAARFPQTVKVVREVMGAAEQALFGNQLAVELD